MALIKCSECSKEISDKASACPNCGAPIEKETKIVNIKRDASAPALKVYITIDNQNIGSIKSGKTITTELSVGKHIVNVNTVGRNGEATSVDGTQVEITSNIERVNILVGCRYSFMSELSGQGQDFKIIEVDYGNGKIINLLKNEKVKKEKVVENTKFNLFNKYKMPIIFLVVIVIIILIILLSSNNNNKYYGTYYTEYETMGKVAIEIDKNNYCVFLNGKRKIECSYNLDTKEEILEIDVPLPVKNEKIWCGRYTEGNDKTWWSCKSDLKDYLTLEKK